MGGRARSRIKNAVSGFAGEYGITPGKAVAAAAIIGLAAADPFLANTQIMAIQAGIASSDPNALLNCSPAVTSAVGKYYKLKSALRH